MASLWRYILDLCQGSRAESRTDSKQSVAKKLTDHIYELFKPETGEPSIFHGLQFGHCPDAYLSTWRTGDASEEVWPGTWLAEEFPQAHVFSISYDCSMRKTLEDGRLDLHNLAENLVQDICGEGIGQGFRRPVIFVGHCFGGLAIKELCVKADHTYSLGPNSDRKIQQIRRFLKNIGGFYFYGTPHRGSHLADKAAYFLDGPLLDYVKSLSTDSARLESLFSSVCKKYEIGHNRMANLGELLETKWGPFHGVVVPEASARYKGEFYSVSADHISLCKPETKISNSFQCLTRFIQSIVPKVRGVECFEKIHPRVSKEAVGLGEGVKHVYETLQRNNVTRVGIVGMGGVGKTTLARALLNALGPTFEYSCFVHEVKLITGSGEEVKKELWKRMYCGGEKVANPSNEDWSQLQGRTLLLILDDAATERDLEVCSNIAEDVGPQSRFIVTSRDRELLKNMDYIYDDLFLNEKNAKQLFMSHAFPGQVEPPAAFVQCVESIVEKCDGLPLTLEVVGKYLKGKKEVKLWKQTLKCLDRADNVAGLNERLWAKLKLSYDGLTREEQMMFLDVTTFFSRNTDCTSWTLCEAKVAWSVNYGAECVRWQTLVDMSLVYDGKEDHPIKVHEQLQSLGRKIASEDNRNGRWIRFRRKVYSQKWKLLQSVDGIDNQEIPSFLLSSLEGGHIKITESGLLRLKELQYLDIIDDGWGMYSKGGHGEKLLPTELVLLQTPAFQFGQVVFDPTLLPRLAVLKLSLAEDVHCLPHSIGHLSSLKILTIRARNLEALPDGIGHLSLLERLRIQIYDSVYSLCPPVHPLLTLPETFGHLSNLKHLEFILCRRLRTLPKSFGQLSMLQSLEFFACRSLCRLPESFGQLSALQNLSFDGCHSLRSIPKWFGRLCELKQLRFESCPIQTLPRSFGRLCQLEYLDFAFCKQLQTLPESMGQLSALKRLSFASCDKLHIVPSFIGQLENLESLEFHYCPKIDRLLFGLGQQSPLRHLTSDSVAAVSISGDGIECVTTPPYEILTIRPYVIPAIRPDIPFSRDPKFIKKKHLSSISFSLAAEWRGCENCRSCTVRVVPHGSLISVQELGETGEPNKFVYSLDELEDLED